MSRGGAGRALRGLGYGLAFIAGASWWFVAIDWAAGNWGVFGFLAAFLGPVFLAAFVWAALDW